MAGTVISWEDFLLSSTLVCRIPCLVGSAVWTIADFPLEPKIVRTADPTMSAIRAARHVPRRCPGLPSTTPSGWKGTGERLRRFVETEPPKSVTVREIPVQKFEFAMQLASILVVLLVVTGVGLDLRRLCSVSLNSQRSSGPCGGRPPADSRNRSTTRNRTERQHLRFLS
jgi:hypothetical protein